MRTPTLAAVLLATAALTVAGCSSQPTKEQIVQQCQAALKAKPAADKAKPKACEPLSKDDYKTLVMAQVINDLGWTDKDGHFDKNKMLDDTTGNPQ